MPADFMLTGC